MRRKLVAYINIVILAILFINPNRYSLAETTEPEVTSLSAILMDATTGQVLYEKDAHTKRYPASTTKLLTAMLVAEKLKPEDTVTFSHDAVYSIEIGASHIGVQEGEVLTVDQAMHGLLLMSANEVANGLAEQVSGSVEEFAKLMTQRAHDLGALDSNFTNPHGLHDDNHYTTAYDYALIVREVIKNDYVMQIMKDTTYQIPPTNKVNETRYLAQQHKMLNEKKDPDIYRADVIAGKTGYTDLAGRTLVTVAKQGDRTLIAVVMKTEGDLVYDDTAKLFDYGFSAFKDATLEPETYKTIRSLANPEGDILGEAFIEMETPVTVSVNTETDPTEITAVYNLPDTLNASASVGDSAGTLEIYDGDKLLATSSLVIRDIRYNEVAKTEADKKDVDFPVIPFLIGLIVLGAFVTYYISKKRALRRTRWYKAQQRRYRW